MNEHEKSLDSHRSFLLMTEIAGDEPISQREISRRLGIAVGLVNSYLKNLVAKGFVRVKDFPSNRYAYLLTPQGVAEKSRLAYQHLSYFTNLYTVARKDYLDLFRRLEAHGVQKVAFCGVDEVAEIAYLSLKQTGIELQVVMDLNAAGSDFFGNTVKPVSANLNLPVVITSLKQSAAYLDMLNSLGVDSKTVFTICN